MFILNLLLNNVSSTYTEIALHSDDDDRMRVSMRNLEAAAFQAGVNSVVKDVKRALNYSEAADDYKAALADAREDVYTAMALSCGKVKD